jgi:hypothetical protein
MFAYLTSASASPNSLEYGLQVYWVTISKVAWLWSAIASPSSLNLCLQHASPTLHDQASMYIFKFMQSRCDELAEFTQHPMGISLNEHFSLEERRKWVRRIEVVLCCEKSHKLCGSMKAWQEYMGQRPGKHRLCILYNEMMSMKADVSPIYTPTWAVYLRYPNISISPIPVPPSKPE